MNASLNQPRGLAFDAAGNLFIACTSGDPNKGSVRKVTPGGVISTAAANLLNPRGVTFDKGGVMYIGTDSGVYKLLPGASVPQLIAGSAQRTVGFSGDGGPALNAVFNGPLLGGRR